MILASVGHWLLHATGGDNGNSPYYLEPSGFVGALEGLGIVGTVLGLLRHHNCHEPWCLRPGHSFTAPDGSAFMVCHRHHPIHPRRRRALRRGHLQELGRR